VIILILQLFLLALFPEKLVERFELIATTGKNAKPHLFCFSQST
jgi:hypothetical protein